MLELEIEVRPKSRDRQLAHKLIQALERAGALKLEQGRGRPTGRSVSLREGGLISASVVAARDEDERVS